MTRQQRYFSQALADVQAVHEMDTRTAAIYGGVCHTLPILVLTNGLCQTAAFIEDKASGAGKRGCAYQALREHIENTLGLKRGSLAEAVHSAPSASYMRYTRAILQAWVYYKRFAVSILKVEASAASEDDADEEMHE